MTSIRRALVLYFLVLLAVALGSVWILVYGNTQRIVTDKDAAMQHLLKGKYQGLRESKKAELDSVLRRQASLLWRSAVFQYQARRSRFSVALAAVATCNMGIDVNSALLAPLWLEFRPGPRPDGRPRWPFADYVRHLPLTDFQLNEDELPHDPDSPITEYFQINSDSGFIWRSDSMLEHSFPFDRKSFAQMKAGVQDADDWELTPGVFVRRVLLKAPLNRIAFTRAMRPNRAEGRQPSAAPTRLDQASPMLLVQVAAEKTALSTQLDDLQSRLNNDLADMELESSATLASLRNKLLIISLATFAATVLGGLWLVRVGLAPLQRLSEAVSRVSPKDFRLPFSPRPLPTELRPIVDRLSQTLGLLEKAFARERQAAADISHELRTPLASLLTTIEVALRKSRTPDEYKTLLADCYAAGQQMSQLVERLLALARIDAGVDALHPREVDVADLAEQCVNLVRPLAEARGVAMRLERNGPAIISTDPDKLREVLTNLLHNAIDYNRPQGTIDVVLGRNNGALQVDVRDTGVGISPEACEHLFERFYRADPSRHADGLHAGLGLAIVKGYVELLSGRITVESKEGHGSTFRVELPA